jgi:hypothetical protein
MVEVVLAAILALASEVLGVVRAAMESWSLTARLCVIVIVVVSTGCITGLVLG